MKRPRWLVILITLTVAGLVLPAIGMLIPPLESLRGFALSWSFLLFAWVVVAFYHAFKFLYRWLE